jgi:hypothetical protein
MIDEKPYHREFKEMLSVFCWYFFIRKCDIQFRIIEITSLVNGWKNVERLGLQAAYKNTGESSYQASKKTKEATS